MASVAAIHKQQGETIIKMLSAFNTHLDQLETAVYKGNQHSQQPKNDAAINKPRGPVICWRCGKEGHFARGCMCCQLSGKLAALDATGQAEEGYNIVTHGNETLCNFTHVLIN